MEFLLIEPIAKTPYPPLGLMKISSMLKSKYKDCCLFSQVGNKIPKEIKNPKEIYITSLFTWDLDKVVDSIRYYSRLFPSAKIKVGGIAASLYPEFISSKTGIQPHQGLLEEAEDYSPDYHQNFERKLNSSLTFTSRGCIRNCPFCTVRTVEPEFFTKNNWEEDICDSFPTVTFWDNNWLASPNIEKDCAKLIKLNKKVDFNQGLDARLYDENKARMLSKININPIRFAFDDISYEKYVLKAIRLAKKYSKNEIRVYVLYNFRDKPEDFFYRINLLNKEKVLSFPMEYRSATDIQKKFPGKHWNLPILRAIKLSLLFYYHKGMITESRQSFRNIYGRNQKTFINKLYKIYEYDKKIVKNKNKEKELKDEKN